MGSNDLPPSMRALVLESISEPPTIQTRDTPQPTLGSAVVKILAANVISYIRDIYNGKRNYSFPTPVIPGTSAIGRIAAIGPDATKLKPGDLVLVDCTIRSRDDPADVFLAAITHGHTPGSAKLANEVFRDWTYAEYARTPLECLTLINEKRLFGSKSEGGLGYTVEELGVISTMMVPYGGLKDIELQPGQTVIVTPATGPFGGAAVLVALAMGARVIAMGRNKESLASIMSKVPYPERLEAVPITGDVEADLAELKKFGRIDAWYDIGPPEAQNSSHLRSCIMALRHGARVSLMGGYRGEIPIPHAHVMHKNIRLYGKWMFERGDISDLLQLVETGLLKLGEAGGSTFIKTFPLEQWKEAWDCAAENAGIGSVVLIRP